MGSRELDYLSTGVLNTDLRMTKEARKGSLRTYIDLPPSNVSAGGGRQKEYENAVYCFYLWA